jgi:hypothetical protein
MPEPHCQLRQPAILNPDANTAENELQSTASGCFDWLGFWQAPGIPQAR